MRNGLNFTKGRYALMENTKIEWCDHTFNPWIGCVKVSPGCTNCYAETLMDKRFCLSEMDE